MVGLKRPLAPRCLFVDREDGFAGAPRGQVECRAILNGLFSTGRTVRARVRAVEGDSLSNAMSGICGVVQIGGRRRGVVEHDVLDR
jgi:hypothetical protein